MKNKTFKRLQETSKVLLIIIALYITNKSGTLRKGNVGYKKKAIFGVSRKLQTNVSLKLKRLSLPSNFPKRLLLKTLGK
jgi:hypothetical protein